MHDRFLQFIKKHALIEKGDRVLLAVSGGVDSMVLLNLFKQSDFPFAVAHCNFQLRGKASDKDESLVKSFCLESDIPFYAKRFETKAYAHDNGVSTQMAARDLRFDWFNELCLEFEYSKVALAHHRDDSIETFFLNLTRGTSLRGLRGIQAKNGNLIRPLLSFSKDELIEFANSERVRWREDASNQEVYYKRNLIRHELLPILRQLNPDFEVVMEENLLKLESRYQTSEIFYEQLRKQLINTKEQGLEVISIKEIKRNCCSAYDLYELLRQFSFNFKTCEKLFNSLDQIGSKFFSVNFELLVDREELFVRRAGIRSRSELVHIQPDDMSFQVGSSQYKLRLLEKVDWSLERSSKNAALDYNLLKFPLTIRHWKEGDSFQPLGMKGSKLVSDLLIDLKVPLFKKDHVMVLFSGNEIAWVIGLRISEKYKVTENTKKVWRAEMLDSYH